MKFHAPHFVGISLQCASGVTKSFLPSAWSQSPWEHSGSWCTWRKGSLSTVAKEDWDDEDSDDSDENCDEDYQDDHDDCDEDDHDDCDEDDEDDRRGVGGGAGRREGGRVAVGHLPANQLNFL